MAALASILSILPGIFFLEACRAFSFPLCSENSLCWVDELRGKLVGLLVAPAGAIARVCKAYSEKEEQAA